MTCPVPECYPIFKHKYFASVSGSVFDNVQTSSDCSTGLLIMTDNPGLVDIEDVGGDPFLSTDGRVKSITSIEDAADHWSSCSSIYRSLQSFFLLDAIPGSRPGQIQVGYWDSAAETMTEAFQAMSECGLCAWWVTVDLFKNDGTQHYGGTATPVFDSAELLDLDTEISASDEYKLFVPTAEASQLVASHTETGSQAALANSQGSKSVYTLLSYICDGEVDENCDPVIDGITGEQELVNYYTNSALTAAAHAASFSQYSTNLNWTLYHKPIGHRTTGNISGVYLDETTGDTLVVNMSNAKNITGVDGLIGSGSPNFLPDVTRHVSLYVRDELGTTLIEGLTVDGQWVDVWAKNKAFNERLLETVHNFLGDQIGFGISQKEALKLAGAVEAEVIRPFINNNVINQAYVDWENEGYTNILFGGGDSGYVISTVDLENVPDAAISQRNARTLIVCPNINEPQHRVGVAICPVL